MRYLVVDSGPLIKGVRLERIDAERFVTVPEVLRPYMGGKEVLLPEQL